jgi:hypothetical protein
MQLPEPSCVLGYTAADLNAIFTEAEMQAFSEFMFGQTQVICDGRQYHYNRAHGEWCRRPVLEGGSGHTDDDDLDWRCDYASGGYYEDSVCAGNAHGIITYVHDVQRYVDHKMKGTPLIWD